MNAYTRILALCILVCGSAAQATLLEPDDIGRYVTVRGGGPQIWQPATGVDPFSATLTSANGLATATQNSTITVDTISISGSASASGDDDNIAAAGSYLQEQFTLTSQTPYRFSTDYINNGEVSSHLTVYLTWASGDIFRQFFYDDGTWASSGYLEPGQYTIGVGGTAGAEDFYWSSPSMSFSATFSLTPEPATGALLGIGALGLLRRPRRRT